MDRFWNIRFAWMGLLLALVILGSYLQPSATERRIIADEATHISAALSIWHDLDLKYSTQDLEHFRTIVPEEPGPTSAFLKYGNSDNIYYAKPFIYAAILAPFLGLIGLKGIFVLNVIFLGIIGAIGINTLRGWLSDTEIAALLLPLLLISPFLAWTPIAHPDLFIACLLSVGGYLLINRSQHILYPLFGAIILGIAVYEKITFAPLVIAIFLTQIGSRRTVELLILSIATTGAWLAPSLVNFMQDGNLSAYKGMRFLAQGTVGSFPLEEDWPGLPANFTKSDPFGFGALLNAISANLFLMPQKIGDFLIGRQTGILVYFPHALILAALIIARRSWKPLILLAALLGYLVLNWLAFPMNGYGGAATYGPRYMMQALPFIFLAAFFIQESRKPGKLILAMVAGATIFAVSSHYKIYPPKPFSAYDLNQVLTTGTIQHFPLETILLPTISEILPERRLDTKENHQMFSLCEPTQIAVLELSQQSGECKIALFQFHAKHSTPRLEFLATKAGRVRLSGDLPKPAEIDVTAGKESSIDISPAYGRDYLAVGRGYFRTAEIEVEFSNGPRAKRSLPARMEFGFAGQNRELVTARSRIPLNVPIAAQDFEKYGIERRFDWGSIEDWGVWTTGEVATLAIPGSTDPTEKINSIELEVIGYTPKNAEELVVDVFLDHEIIETWRFNNARRAKSPVINLGNARNSSREKILIGFHVKNPRSPLSVGRGKDTRNLGIGLRQIRLKK